MASRATRPKLFFCGIALAISLAAPGAGAADAVARALATPVTAAWAGLPLRVALDRLGGIGSIGGAFVGAYITGFVYTFGQTLLPAFSYVILFLPMIVVLAFRPSGLFGKSAP